LNILLGSGLLSKALLLYRELADDSNILRTAVKLYEACGKPEKAEQWRAKLPQTETKAVFLCLSLLLTSARFLTIKFRVEFSFYLHEHYFYTLRLLLYAPFYLLRTVGM
jgi:hypothetical protein